MINLTPSSAKSAAYTPCKREGGGPLAMACALGPALGVALGLALMLSLIAPPSKASAAAEKKKGGGETYLQLPTLTAAVIHAGGRPGVLMVDVGLDIPDARLRARAASSIPILRDAFTQVMLTYAPTLGPYPPNPDAIAADLQRVTDRVLGRAGATLLLGTTLEN